MHKIFNIIDTIDRLSRVSIICFIGFQRLHNPRLVCENSVMDQKNERKNINFLFMILDFLFLDFWICDSFKRYMILFKIHFNCFLFC